QLEKATVTVVPTYLYIAQRLDNGETAERFYLCTLPAGALILPISIKGYAFIAVPTEATADTQAAPPDARALVLWQSAIVNAPFLAHPSSKVKIAKSGEKIHLDTETSITAKDVLWAVASDPNLTIVPGTGINSENQTPVAVAPVGPGWILSADHETDVRILEPETLFHKHGLEGIKEVWEAWAHLAVEWLEIEFQRAEDQAQTSQERSKKSYQDALEHIAAAAEGVDRVSTEPELVHDPLLAALSTLGELQGITIKTPAHDDRVRNVHERLRRIAQASHFRYRLVTLTGRWWRESGVPLLAFGQEGSMFVLKSSRYGYIRLDPATGIETRLQKSNANQLLEQAYMIYATFPARITGHGIISFALETARRDGWWTAGAALVVALIGLLVPIVTGVIVGQAIPFARYALLAELVLILVAVAVGSTLFRIIQGLATARVNAQVDLRLQPAIWDRVMRLPSRFFRRYGVGDLVQRVLGIKTISNILSSTAIGALLAGILSLTSFIVMVYIDVPLTLFAAALAVGIALLLGLLSRSQLKWTRQVFTLKGRVLNLVLQVLSAIPKIRVAAAEERVFKRWADAYAKQRANQTQAAVVRNVTETLMIAIPIFGSIGLFLIVGLRGASLDVAAFIAFNAAFGQFMMGALTLSQAITSSINVIPLYDRLQPVLDASPEIDPDREDPGKLTGMISLS
ncbi:MAG: hypothetical protein KAT29_10310, partial [Anaerolineales bacterium]|nr:hypothetical protein [Anaerolineales bacterium]